MDASAGIYESNESSTPDRRSGEQRTVLTAGHAILPLRSDHARARRAEPDV